MQAPEPSAPTARIVVILDGKPQSHVQLTVRLPQGGQRSLFTNGRGTATLKKLPVGMSCVVASRDNRFQGNLCLAVSNQAKTTASSFTLNLFDGLKPMERTVRAAEASAEPVRLRQLRGIIQDPVGTGIPRAQVAVYQRGSYPQGPVATVSTDDKGRFLAALNPGSYTLVISAPGFETIIRVVDILPDGENSQLIEKLKIGPMC